MILLIVGCRHYYVAILKDLFSGITGLLAQRLSHYNPPALPFAFSRKYKPCMVRFCAL